MNAALAAMRQDFVEPAPDLLADTLAGLSRTPKQLMSKYFYDARGSQLFEQITRQPEYYLTRVEQALLEARLDDIAALIGAGAHVVEYGSGSGRKTRQLLAALADPIAYTPVEISPSALLASIAALAAEFPHVQMLPVCADFTRPVPLPVPDRRPHRTLVFFPGSTLGNFADARIQVSFPHKLQQSIDDALPGSCAAQPSTVDLRRETGSGGPLG